MEHTTRNQIRKIGEDLHDELSKAGVQAVYLTQVKQHFTSIDREFKGPVTAKALKNVKDKIALLEDAGHNSYSRVNFPKHINNTENEFIKRMMVIDALNLACKQAYEAINRHKKSLKGKYGENRQGGPMVCFSSILERVGGKAAFKIGIKNTGTGKIVDVDTGNFNGMSGAHKHAYMKVIRDNFSEKERKKDFFEVIGGNEEDRMGCAKVLAADGIKLDLTNMKLSERNNFRIVDIYIRKMIEDKMVDKMVEKELDDKGVETGEKCIKKYINESDLAERVKYGVTDELQKHLMARFKISIRENIENDLDSANSANDGAIYMHV